MRKISTLFFALLIVFSCDGQSGFHALLSASNATTTPSGQQVFLFLGDSNADGRGSSIPTVAAATLYRWNGSSVDEITTQTVANDGSYGSIWQYFATEYKSVHGKKTVGVFQGYSGTRFADTGDHNDFSTTGTRYATAVSEANDALAFLGLTKLKAVVVNLGLNDISGAATTGTIQTAIASFISRITADFPDTPILFIQPGQAAVNDNSKAYTVRNYLIGQMDANTNCHLFAAGLAYAYVTSAYNGDFIHYENVMLENLGKQLSRWFSNSAYTKWPRSVITAHHSDLTAPHKALVNTFVTNLYASGDFFLLEQYGNFKTEAYQDALLDWTFKGSFGWVVSLGFSANAYCSTNGTNSYMFASYANSYFTGSGAGQNDFITGIRLITNNSGTVTVRVMLCRQTLAGAAIRIGQVGANTIYNSNDDVNSAGAEVGLASGNLYSVARSGTTKYLYKNKTTNASVVETSDASMLGLIIGVNFQENGISPPIFLYWLDATYGYYFAAVHTGFDRDYFYDEAEALMSAW